ncbi:MAG: hypothetical protein H6718_36830 [Polyangiaceae bacterium]|nr:hypothetical protein [Myxococcales bacterium]MCB9591029.1 hypothetical protein [Polyangiaceae bacterium]
MSSSWSIFSASSCSLDGAGGGGAPVLTGTPVTAVVGAGAGAELAEPLAEAEGGAEDEAEGAADAGGALAEVEADGAG